MIEFTDKPFRKKIEKDKQRFLIASGQVAVNQAVDLSRVDTGLSRNAKYFAVTTFDSEFGSLPGKDGKVERPDESLKGVGPDEGVVAVYAPLNYDVYLERRYGIMKRSLVLSKALFGELIKRIFR